MKDLIFWAIGIGLLIFGYIMSTIYQNYCDKEDKKKIGGMK